MTNKNSCSGMSISELSLTKKHQLEVRSKYSLIPYMPEYTHQLLHKLEAQRIELESQNTTLQQIQTKTICEKKRYSPLCDASPVGYMLLDHLGNINDLNLVAQAMLGLDNTGWNGKSLLEFIFDHDALIQYLSLACYTHTTQIVEVRLQSTQNEVTDLKLEIKLIECSKESSCQLGTFVTDISQRKNLERNLKLCQNDIELLLVQQSAMQTSSKIAHDLYDPLTALTTYNEVALEYLSSDLINQDKLRNALQAGIKQAHRVVESLTALIEYLESKNNIAVESLNLNFAILNVLKTTNCYRDDNFSYQLELQEDLNQVWANPIHLQIALENLIHCSGDSQQKQLISITSSAKQNMALVTIIKSDQPTYIDTDRNKVNSFIGNKPKTINIQLATSRALLESNAGQLWIESDSQHEETICFTLPFSNLPV